jgi:DNA primase
MLGETAKVMREKITSDQRRIEIRTGDATPETPKAEPSPITNKPSTELNATGETASDSGLGLREHKELAQAEMEIIRLLVRFGHRTLMEPDESTGDSGITVAGYIIRELTTDELNIQQPLLRKVFDEYSQVLISGVTVDDMYFLHHPDPDVSRITASFEPKYELSKIHYKNGATVKTDENNLLNVVASGLLALKKRHVELRLKEISVAMQQAETEHDINRYEMLSIQLVQVRKTLGSFLGQRTIELISYG